MSRARRTNGGEEECLKDICGKARSKDISRETKK
jgi:hypothetical protein